MPESATTKDASIDDVADAIQGLATLMDKGFRKTDQNFAKVNKRLDGLSARMDAAETSLRSINQKLDRLEASMERLEGKRQALEADVKELYRMIRGLRQDFVRLNQKDRERLASLELFAKTVSRKTNIPYSL